MLNVNEDTIKAYTEQSVPKKLIITFPNNKNLKSITNDNIQEESMTLTGSLCSDSNLTLQGCISTQFNVTTFDYDTDITGQEIIATLSVYDDEYKGEWCENSEYREGNIVKFNQEYYLYTEDVEAELTDFIKRNNVSDKDVVYNETATNKYNILGREPEYLMGVNFSTNWTEIPEGVEIVIRSWYTGGPYYKISYITKMSEYNADIFFPKNYPIGSDYPLKGWFAEINYTGTDTAEFKDFVESLEIYELTGITKNNVYPNKLEECQKLYGYVDTSNTEDIVIFRGKVESFTRQAADPRYRDLIAYDKLHDFQEQSIQSWMNQVDSNGRGRTDLYSYQGEYKLNTTYKKDQSVVYYSMHSGSVYKTVYYRFKRDFTDSEYQKESVVSVATNNYGNAVAGRIKGSEYVEELTAYYPNRITVKQLRDDLCSYLGITQETTTLPMDNVQLIIGPLTESYSATQLLQWICNMNGVCAIIEQSTGLLKYVFVNRENNSIGERTNYQGEYDSNYEEGMLYNVGDVVKYRNSYGEERYYERILGSDVLFPNNLKTSDIKFIFYKKTNYKISTGDTMWLSNKNVHKLELEFDDELAQELGVELTISATPNRDDTSIYNSITLRQSGTVMLSDLYRAEEFYFKMKVTNVNEQFLKTFKVICYESIGQFDSSWPLESEYLSDIWKKLNILYHPSGMINITNLYEQDSVELQDNLYVNNGWKVLDMSGNLLNGENKKNNIPITYSPLYSAQKSSYQLLLDVASNVGKGWISPVKAFTIKFSPFKAKSLGIPFLQLGDYVTFDVDKWSSDDEGNPIITRQNIQSIILNKTMSGINALSDEYEAKND